MGTHKFIAFEALSTEEPPSDSQVLPIIGFKESQTSSHSPTGPSLSAIRERIVALLWSWRKVGHSPSMSQSLRPIILASWLNILLLCIPVSWVLHFTAPDKRITIFVFSFLAMIPLAELRALATNELSSRVGQILAGLINATLGNATGLIFWIIALKKCELTIVQSSLVGLILINILLVLGMCFFAGGLRFSEQGFGSTIAQTNSALLMISATNLLLPNLFHIGLQGPKGQDEATMDQEILKISRGGAVISLFTYFSYLFFQLFSHQNLYDAISAEPTRCYTGNSPFKFYWLRRGRTGRGIVSYPTTYTVDGKDCHPSSHLDPEAGKREQEKEQEPQMNVLMAICLLVTIMAFVAVTAEILVDSIDGIITSGGGISKEFIGVILLPIVSNAPEYIKAARISAEDKLSKSLEAAIGSSIQIGLCVIPFIIIMAWILGKPFSLWFDPFQSTILCLSVIIVSSFIKDGRSNWLWGMMLMCAYLIVGLSYWFYPGTTVLTSAPCTT